MASLRRRLDINLLNIHASSSQGVAMSATKLVKYNHAVYALVTAAFILSGCGSSDIDTARATISAQQNVIEELRNRILLRDETEKNLRENFSQCAQAVDQIRGTFIGVRVSTDMANTSSRSFNYDDWKRVVPQITTNLVLLEQDVAATETAIVKARTAAGLNNLFFDPGKKR